MHYDTSDIRKGLNVMMDGSPYTIIEFQFVKPGKGSAFTRTKFKNLLTGAVVERNVRAGEKLERADVETRDMQFLHKEGGDLVFRDQTNDEQVTISADLIGAAHDLIKDNLLCTVVLFNERPVDVTLPDFVLLEVTASEPGARGDSSGNVQKPATVETGATVGVPLFIVVGDTIKIDTRTRKYVERVTG
jgi:elongation factor P